MLSTVNRRAHHLTGGRIGALGVLMFIIGLALFVGLMMEIFLGGPS